MIKYKFLIFLLLIPVFSFSQKDSIKYTVDFKFKDGVYMNINNVKKNLPIPKEKIVYNGNFDDYNFFDKALSGNVFYIFDNIGKKNAIYVKNVWGYSQNGVLYINWNKQFSRIPVFGNLSHFIAEKTYVENNYNPYNNPYDLYNKNQLTEKKEIRQYLLDMETGKIINYNFKNVEILLMKDEELYDEFVQLKRRKKKQLKFLYLRKYNKKHPFYFK